MRGAPSGMDEVWICGEGGVSHERFCFLIEREGFLEKREFVARVVVQRAGRHF